MVENYYYYSEGSSFLRNDACTIPYCIINHMCAPSFVIRHVPTTTKSSYDNSTVSIIKKKQPSDCTGSNKTKFVQYPTHPTKYIILPARHNLQQRWKAKYKTHTTSKSEEETQHYHTVRSVGSPPAVWLLLVFGRFLQATGKRGKEGRITGRATGEDSTKTCCIDTL